MPTSMWGIALYVFALFPGLAFMFAREGHRATGKRSALRETATVVFVSTVCDAIIVMMFVLLTVFNPDLRLRVVEVLGGSLTWVRENFGLVAIVFLLALALATALGYVLGSKWVHEHGLKVLWNADIPRDTSAWKKVLLPREDYEVRVGLNLKSGMWVSGTLYDFDNDPDNDPHRSITLNKEIRVRAVGESAAAILSDTDWVVVEAGDIEMLQAAYYERPSEVGEGPVDSVAGGRPRRATVISLMGIIAVVLGIGLGLGDSYLAGSSPWLAIGGASALVLGLITWRRAR